MIKSLKKRRELAEMVYARYGGLSKDEKPEYENEVGAAFEAYEKAINDACEWLIDNAYMYLEDVSHFNGTWDIDVKKLIQDFRKAMEE